MRLCHTVRGFSVLDLPPVRVMFYTDDVNLFLSKDEPVAPIVMCLDNTSFAIGSKFNHDKTDVKPIGTLAFQHACFNSGSLHGQTLPGSFILPPSAPLCILGVWVGSSGMAHARWSQISDHITRLICQWQAIGASLPNRVLLAKALMQSRCYYLLDGNSIPQRVLKKISNRIMNFVRGPFCCLPFASLEAPLSTGGVNCPSLISRSTAYNLKFLGDLISGSPSVPWKTWTMHDLTLFSHPSSSRCDIHLNPLLQRAFTKPSRLNDRLAAAFKSTQHVSLDLRSFFPSTRAIADMPLLYHPAIPTQFRSYHPVSPPMVSLMFPTFTLYPIAYTARNALGRLPSFGRSSHSPLGASIKVLLVPLHPWPSAFGLPCATPPAALGSSRPPYPSSLSTTKWAQCPPLVLGTPSPLRPTQPPLLHRCYPCPFPNYRSHLDGWLCRR